MFCAGIYCALIGCSDVKPLMVTRDLQFIPYEGWWVELISHLKREIKCKDITRTFTLLGTTYIYTVFQALLPSDTLDKVE